MPKPRGKKRGEQPPKKTAVGYTRVSADEPGLSLAAQKKAIRAWCKKHGIKLDSIHADIGLPDVLEFEKRPGLTEALAAVKQSRSSFAQYERSMLRPRSGDDS